MIEASHLEILQNAIEKNQKVQVTREGLTHERWNGFPLVLSDDFMLGRTLDDFFLDGFAVLALKDITNVTSDDADRFFEQVLRAEGMLENLPQPRPVLLRSWSTVLESVRAHYRHAIIEGETLDEDEESLFILGEIARVDHDAAWVHYIRVNGLKETELTEVALEDVTIVRFDERYVRMFGKYATSEDQH